MYSYLLITHSYLRWLVLTSLVFGLIFSFIKHTKKNVFAQNDYQLFNGIKNILNIQFLLGILLLFQSPMIKIFWSQLSHSIKWREPRFFGLEHPFMMVLSIVLINLFVHKSKSKISTPHGFKYLFVRLLIILAFIFLSIPWSFSPFTSRPDFRLF